MCLHFQMLATNKLTHLFVLICEITKLLQTSLQLSIVIYHTNQNVLCNFTNEHKQCVNLLVASIWKCKHIE